MIFVDVEDFLGAGLMEHLGVVLFLVTRARTGGVQTKMCVTSQS